MNLSQYFSQSDITQADFARAIGVSPTLLHQWVKNIRPVAAQHCPAIESETQGAVTRKELRPDDWQKIWPELGEAPIATQPSPELANPISKAIARQEPDTTATEEESNEELRREADLGYRQPADPKKVTD